MCSVEEYNTHPPLKLEYRLMKIRTKIFHIRVENVFFYGKQRAISANLNIVTICYKKSCHIRSLQIFYPISIYRCFFLIPYDCLVVCLYNFQRTKIFVNKHLVYFIIIIFHLNSQLADNQHIYERRTNELHTLIIVFICLF